MSLWACRGCSDKSLPWSKKAWSEDPLDTKYPYVVSLEHFRLCRPQEVQCLFVVGTALGAYTLGNVTGGCVRKVLCSLADNMPIRHVSRKCIWPVLIGGSSGGSRHTGGSRHVLVAVVEGAVVEGAGTKVHAEANALLNKNAASVEGAVSGGNVTRLSQSRADHNPPIRSPTALQA
eukprot:1156365-Pelagomonas_calceolata.AAC.7